MRINGEAFFLINAWTDFGCLLLAARIARIRFHPGRALLAALWGAVYAIAAWSKKSIGSGMLSLACVGLMMSLITFGKRGYRLTPLIFAAGWLLAGLSEFAIRRRMNPWAVPLLCGGAALGICLMGRRYANEKEAIKLAIIFRGQRCTVPAMIDSGNLLSVGLTGIPAIIVSERAVKAILPEGVTARDLSTLPSGWRLVGVQTAAGRKTLMCFHPDDVVILQGKKHRSVNVAVVLSDVPINRALLPQGLVLT